MKRGLFLLIALLCFLRLNAQDTVNVSNGKADLLSLQKKMSKSSFGVATGIAYLNESLDYMVTINIDYFFTKRISAGFTYGNFLRDTREKIYSIGVQFGNIEGISQSGLSPFVGLNLVNFRLLDAEPGIEDNTFIWDKIWRS